MRATLVMSFGVPDASTFVHPRLSGPFGQCGVSSGTAAGLKKQSRRDAAWYKSIEASVLLATTAPSHVHHLSTTWVQDGVCAGEHDRFCRSACVDVQNVGLSAVKDAPCLAEARRAREWVECDRYQRPRHCYFSTVILEGLISLTHGCCWKEAVDVGGGRNAGNCRMQATLLLTSKA
jgi:hypothetical protein